MNPVTAHVMQRDAQASGIQYDAKSSMLGGAGQGVGSFKVSDEMRLQSDARLMHVP